MFLIAGGGTRRAAETGAGHVASEADQIEDVPCVISFGQSFEIDGQAEGNGQAPYLDLIHYAGGGARRAAERVPALAAQDALKVVQTDASQRPRGAGGGC